MSRLSRLTTLAALILGLAAIPACSSSNTAGPSATPAVPPGSAAPAGPVTVALLAPSGAADANVAQLGQALVNAAHLAEADLGAETVRVRVYDTGGSAAGATAAARQAMAANAALILGPLFSETTTAVANATGGDINIISFSTDSSIAGGPVFLSGFLPDMAARRIAGFARSRGQTPLAIVYPESGYGQAALAGFEDVAGPALVARTSYPRTAEAIPPAVEAFAQQVLDSGARGLLLADSGQGLQFVAALLAENGVGEPAYQYLGLGEWDTRATLDSPELVGGWFASTDPAALKAFVDRYRARYGTVPPRLAFLGYDAVEIAGELAAAARQGGSGDPFSREAITRPQGFRGVIGPIRFLPDGRGERGMAILEVGEDTFQVIDPAPLAFGAGS